MTTEMQRAIEVAKRIVRGEVVVELTREDLAHVIVDLVAEMDRLVFALHRRCAHPDFEYATTRTARKSGDDPRIGLAGDGWEPNDIVPCHAYVDGAVVKEHWRNWDRFEFHEDNHWRRRR